MRKYNKLFQYHRHSNTQHLFLSTPIYLHRSLSHSISIRSHCTFISLFYEGFNIFIQWSRLLLLCFSLLLNYWRWKNFRISILNPTHSPISIKLESELAPRHPKYYPLITDKSKKLLNPFTSANILSSTLLIHPLLHSKPPFIWSYTHRLCKTLSASVTPT